MNLEAAATPFEELDLRIKRLQESMAADGFDCALFVQRADLFYLSGTGQNGQLVIPATGEPVLLVKKNLERARRESALPGVAPFEGWSHLLETVKANVSPGGKIGLEMDVIPANHYLRYKELFEPESFVPADISPLIRSIRAIKSDYEISLLRVAAMVSESVFTLARESIREGMTEIELATELERHARAGGHQGMLRLRGFNQELFYGQVLGGAAATVPTFFDGPTGGPGLNPSFPLGSGTGKINGNEPVLIDFATAVNGYIVDQTRIFSLGRLPDHLERAYNTALQIRERLVTLGKAGTGANELYNYAVNMAKEAGLAKHFMGYDEKVSFIGHGVGIELDELPVITGKAGTSLEKGMVFALEPKFVFPGEGAVGIEDTYVVREWGLEQITRFDQDIQTIENR